MAAMKGIDRGLVGSPTRKLKKINTTTECQVEPIIKGSCFELFIYVVMSSRIN